jgi:ribose transport system substrate-binding protein
MLSHRRTVVPLGYSRCLAALATGAALLALAACSTASSSAGSTTSASSKNLPAGVKAADALVAKYENVPTYPSPGPAFDASAAKGKLIYIIPIVASGFNDAVVGAAKSAGSRTGAHIVVYNTTGQLSQYQAGVDAAIAAHANVIDLEAVNPATVAPQLRKARAAGIKITLNLFEDGLTKPPAGFSGGVNFPLTLAGTLEGDNAVAATAGKLNALILTASDSPQTTPLLAGIESAIKEHCPGCKYTVVGEPVASWPNFQQSTATALNGNPAINYVISAFDSYASFALAGVTEARAASRIHMDGLNGTPAVLTIMKQGIFQMDTGMSATALGYSEIDNDLRVATGQAPVTSVGQLRVFIQGNLVQAGSPPSYSDGYGTDLLAPYLKAWEQK